MKRRPTKAIAFLIAAATLVSVAGFAQVPDRPDDFIVRHRVDSKSPIVGMHTRLTDEVEEWKIRKTLQMVREMGATWIVEYFPWAYVEPRKGRFDWKHADLVMRSAYAEGLAVAARIDLVPEWARPDETTGRYLDRDHYADYANFLRTFAARYKGRVKYLIVWNEPNTSFEWGYRPVSLEEYAELLKMAYLQVKNADPEVVVVSAGLAPTLEKSPLALDDLVFLQRMYDAGARDYFDVLGVHSYGGKFPPDDPPSSGSLNFARAVLLRQVMESNGDGSKPMLITEAGWNDHPRWAKAVRPGQRLDYTLRAYQKAEQEWPWVQGLAMWAFRLPWPARNYNDYYTFVTQDFTPKPIYEAVKKWARPG
ncbi:MAG: beta-galactosidase [Chloroflexi bacterium]|nr:beta-galactosidase [Chloroflexota bacterium]